MQSESHSTGVKARSKPPPRAGLFYKARWQRRTETAELLMGLSVAAVCFAVLYATNLLGAAAEILPGRINVKGVALAVSFFSQRRCVLMAAYVVVALASVHVVRRRLPYADPLIMPLAVTLMAIGVLWQTRLAPFIAERHGSLSLLAGPDKQLIWATAAIAAAAVSAVFMNVKRWSAVRDRKYVCILAAAVAIVLTGLMGHEINNKRLWIRVGGVTIQTVEFAKILVVIFLSAYLAERGPYMAPRRFCGVAMPEIQYSGPLAVMMVLALAPIFLQGDLGPTFLLVGLLIVDFYLATSAAACVLTGIAVVGAAAAAMYHLGWPTIVRWRVDMWLHPFERSEHMVSSLWAVAAGGPLGTGMLRGVPHTVPVVHSDFIFTAIAEEWGMLGAGLVLALIAAFVVAGFRVAACCRDRFFSLVAASIATLIGLQTIVIVGGVTGMLPLTGITMPFLSYGGSAMLANGILVGMLAGISGIEEERVR
jgi:cell division protein FtsW (lipid II flippase)